MPESYLGNRLTSPDLSSEEILMIGFFCGNADNIWKTKNPTRVCQPFKKNISGFNNLTLKCLTILIGSLKNQAPKLEWVKPLKFLGSSNRKARNKVPRFLKTPFSYTQFGSKLKWIFKDFFEASCCLLCILRIDPGQPLRIQGSWWNLL